MNQITIPGILGGLGPLAHIHFERQLISINATYWNACRDQEHPVWIALNATDVPDRKLSLAGLLEDCTPKLVNHCQTLEQAGANFIVVTCNTAHAFYEAVQTHISIPWLHLMELTSQHIQKQYPNFTRIGILATDGTIQAGLYQKSLQHYGLTPLSLEQYPNMQQQVMDAIYHPQWGIKATGDLIREEVVNILQRALECLAHQDCQLVIVGCTELSVVFAREQPQRLPWVDPLDLAAHLTLDLAYGRTSLELLQNHNCFKK
jgi:aspartate racemase